MKEKQITISTGEIETFGNLEPGAIFDTEMRPDVIHLKMTAQGNPDSGNAVEFLTGQRCTIAAAERCREYCAHLKLGLTPSAAGIAPKQIG